MAAFSGDIYQLILENSFDGFYITDEKANTIYINQAYQEISGLRADEVIGKNMRDLVGGNVISNSGTLLVLETGQAVTLHQTFKTGKQALITSSPIRDSRGRIIMVATNVRDLTEIYNLKVELDRQARQQELMEEQLKLLRKDILEGDLIAKDEKTLRVLRMIDRVKDMDTTVTFLGETGVGKEVFAKYLHHEGKRHDHPFIKINCGAIPENLMESEFFGYEKGAFTGAEKGGKAGYFEVADKGTLFLDEIGEMPLSMQVKLLRILQEEEVMRIGSSQTVHVDVRVIAATNRNLEQMVREGTFREDLFYRLMVYPVEIPPLRERQEDIVALTQHFTSDLNSKYGYHKKFSDLAMEIMTGYDWPGNIRELKNVVERTFIISNEDTIYPEDLSIYQSTGAQNHFFEMGKGQPLSQYLQKLEQEYIDAAYRKYGNVRDAARSLGMSAATLTRKKNRDLRDKEETEENK